MGRMMITCKKKAQAPKDASFGESAIAEWTSCAITQEPLKPPVVTDELGYLMNKQRLLESMLSKTLDRRFAHIKSIKKDVQWCKLTLSAHGSSSSSSSRSSSSSVSKAAKSRDLEEKTGSSEVVAAKADPTRVVIFHCPITMLPANGKYRFVAIRGCGCVLSERAVKEVPSDVCLLCGRKWDSSPRGRILLNPSVEVRDQMRKDIEARLLAKKKEKEAELERSLAKMSDEERAAYVKKRAKREKKKRKREKADESARVAALGDKEVQKKLKSKNFSSLFSTESNRETDHAQYNRYTR